MLQKVQEVYKRELEVQTTNISRYYISLTKYNSFAAGYKSPKSFVP